MLVKLSLLQLHLRIHHLRLACEILSSKNVDFTFKYALYILKVKSVPCLWLSPLEIRYFYCSCGISTSKLIIGLSMQLNLSIQKAYLYCCFLTSKNLSASFFLLVCLQKNQQHLSPSFKKFKLISNTLLDLLPSLKTLGVHC